MSAWKMWMLLMLSFWRRVRVASLLRTRPITVFEGSEASFLMNAYPRPREAPVTR